MDLSRFLEKHEIILSPGIEAVCEQGLRFMDIAKDKSHARSHVYRLISDLDQMLRESKEVKKSQIDFDILLLAICWHDTWRSGKITSNLAFGTFVLAWDGIGSALHFKQHGKRANIHKKTVKQTAYAIRKHAFFQFLQTRTLEGRILKDLDTLEMFSVHRIQELAETQRLHPKLTKKGFSGTMQYFFNRFLKHYPHERFYFEWSKKLYKKRKAKFIRHAAAQIKSGKTLPLPPLEEQS